ncbi:putative secondary metabolism biosynthetic enzyme [Rhinocladiella similis]
MLLLKPSICLGARGSLRGGLPRPKSVKFVVTRALSLQSQPGVRILEVAPRDGLQNVKNTIPTATKVELIHKLADAGLRYIEATSFVSPKWVPQLADSATVMEQIRPLIKEGVWFPVLAPNLKGLENALASQSQEVVVFASATEAFSKANQNCSIEEALAGAQKVATAAKSHGVRVRGVISCVFSDPYSGPADPHTVLRIAKRFLSMGCYEVGLGDTIGVGTTYQTQKLLELLLSEIPANQLAGHFHDTYGQALANIFAAYSMGIRSFDSAAAGLGGCPYAKGAKGNVATEDIVYAFENSGISTGVDLKKLVGVGEWISGQIGIPNGSRAGSAFASKQKSSVTPILVPASSPPKKQWKTIQETPDYRVSRAGSAVKVVLTRSKHGNTMTRSMLEGLTQVYTELAKDRTVFHIVLAAEGKFFCTGMDLSGETNTADTRRDQGYHALINALFTAIDNSPQITIALIDGPCYGGGVGLGFVCDVRLATPKATWTLSEVKIGVCPAIISRYMAREWGVSFFREAMLSGRQVGCLELQRIGAVHSVGEDSNQLLNEYLEKLAFCAPKSASICKELVKLAWRTPGTKEQDRFIEQTFHSMMLPGTEGEYGLSQFQKKNRNIAWEEFWKQDGKSNQV